MDQWLKDHAGWLVALLSFFISVCGLVWALARKDAKVEDVCDRIEKTEQRVEQQGRDLSAHRENTSRHVDPERDERRWEDLNRLLTDMNRKIDRLFFERRP